MANLQYKTFVWPQDPATYSERVLRTPVYQELDDGSVIFTGISGIKRTITGSGVFTGPEAAGYYQQLEELVCRPAPGDLVHPTWGTRNCYFTELKMTQEPENQVIHYQFTFTWADSDNVIPK